MNLIAKIGEPVWMVADMLGDSVWVVALGAFIFFIMYDGPVGGTRNKPHDKPKVREWFFSRLMTRLARMVPRRFRKDGGMAPWNKEWLTSP